MIVQEVFKVVASAREQGISVLLVEQNVRAAVEIADRAYVLDDGKVVYSGAAAEFAKDEERVRALAGASAEEWEPQRLARLSFSLAKPYVILHNRLPHGLAWAFRCRFNESAGRGYSQCARIPACRPAKKNTD